MADQYIPINSGTGPKVDVSELSVNTQIVERQRMIVGDNTTAANYLAIDASGCAKVRQSDGTNFAPTGDVVARKSYVALTDGSTSVAVKSSSTAPIVGDAALVVSISPNSASHPVSLQGGTNIIGKAGIDQTTPGTTNAVTLTGTSGGGLAFFTTAITNAATAVKAAPCQLYGYDLFNINSVVVYVQIFNKLVGSVTPGTTAADWVIVLPPNGGRNVFTDIGIAHSVGLTVAVTTGRANGVAPGSNVDLNFFLKP